MHFPAKTWQGDCVSRLPAERFRWLSRVAPAGNSHEAGLYSLHHWVPPGNDSLQLNPPPYGGGLFFVGGGALDAPLIALSKFLHGLTPILNVKRQLIFIGSAIVKKLVSML